jgi:hypothetical protein
MPTINSSSREEDFLKDYISLSFLKMSELSQLRKTSRKYLDHKKFNQSKIAIRNIQYLEHYKFYQNIIGGHLFISNKSLIKHRIEQRRLSNNNQHVTRDQKFELDYLPHLFGELKSEIRIIINCLTDDLLVILKEAVENLYKKWSTMHTVTVVRQFAESEYKCEEFHRLFWPTELNYPQQFLENGELNYLLAYSDTDSYLPKEIVNNLVVLRQVTLTFKLQAAINNNDMVLAEKLIGARVNVNAYHLLDWFPRKDNPFLCALKSGHVDIILLFLKQGFDLKKSGFILESADFFLKVLPQYIIDINLAEKNIKWHKSIIDFVIKYPKFKENLFNLISQQPLESKLLLLDNISSQHCTILYKIFAHESKEALNKNKYSFFRSSVTNKIIKQLEEAKVMQYYPLRRVW